MNASTKFGNNLMKKRGNRGLKHIRSVQVRRNCPMSSENRYSLFHWIYLTEEK